ncbi:hypothetical protein ACIBCC_19660 [Streptomyces griseus]|uniref:hypothetical protein n=1 Tax=Streptomyces griseus TaxID=1911 RepID=UPI0037AE86B3
MSTPMTREQRTQRLADLRARMAARNVTLSGGPLMSLPLNRRVGFAISDPGAITPRGDDYREPLHAWQARAVASVLPEATEADRLPAESDRLSGDLTGANLALSKGSAPVIELSKAEQQFLAFALELAADQMASRGDEFDDADEAALERLRTLTGEVAS